VSALRHAGSGGILDTIEALRIDPHNLFVHRALRVLLGRSRHELEAIDAGTFVYAVVFAIDGVGLLLVPCWAEYLTLIVTASFIPLEIYDLVQHASVPKLIAIAVNAAIVVYLAVKLRAAERRRPCR
jgi:uncharacterized membrane protein (DUF2068 family)